MQAYSPTLYGTVTLNGSIQCSPVVGRKIDIYNDGAGTVYGFGLNDFEFCLFGGAGSRLTYRVAATGAPDLAGIVEFQVTDTGINATDIGVTTPGVLRCTTLAVTGSLTAKFVLATPNAAAGAPGWRQLLASDISGLGTFATANTAAPPAIGDTTANTGRFSTLTATGQVLRTFAGNLTASATNTQAGALGLTALLNVITTAAANTAVRLPNAAPVAGTFAEIIVRNQGANAVNCFPATSGVINALAANTAISIPAGTVMHFGQTSATQYYVI